MKIGFVGPADGEELLLREAMEFLVTEAGAEQSIYLGDDDILAKVVWEWARTIVAGDPGEAGFLERAAALGASGGGEELRALLDGDEIVQRLSTIRCLPRPPARAIEMIGDRILTIVHDKAVLTEEDIANSALVVYGKAKQELLKRFGPRYFLTPGPLKGGKVALVEADEEGQVAVGMYAPTGAPLWRESLQGRMTGKVMVSS